MRTAKRISITVDVGAATMPAIRDMARYMNGTFELTTGSNAVVFRSPRGISQNALDRVASFGWRVVGEEFKPVTQRSRSRTKPPTDSEPAPPFVSIDRSPRTPEEKAERERVATEWLEAVARGDWKKSNRP